MLSILDYVLSIIFITTRNMDEVIEFLCPHIPKIKILKRCELFKLQLLTDTSNPDLPTLPPSVCLIICVVCGNTDMCNTLNNEVTGTCICLGVDGNGCGCELIETTFYSSPQQRE